MSEQSPSSDGPEQIVLARRVTRRVTLAAMLGSLIEYYEFMIYAFLATTIAPLFFPSGDDTASLLATLAVFGVGMIMRPLGGAVLGSVGDRLGRRHALAIAIIGMGAATSLIAVLPTYAQVGIIAPLLLVLCRLVQGFSAGGEVMGALTYVLEVSPAGERGLRLSIPATGATLGIALAPAVVGLTSYLTTDAQMAGWGWRIPFLIALPLSLVCVYYRLRIEESPEFQELAKNELVEKSPLLTLIRDHWRPIVQVVLLSFATLWSAYAINSYMNIYMTTALGIASQDVYWLSTIVLLLGAPMLIVSGYTIDRIGPRWVVMIGMAGIALLTYPLMLGMNSTSSIFLIGVAYLVLVSVNNFLTAAAYRICVGSFPSSVRFSGAAIGYNIGAVVGGGLAAYASAQSIALTGSNLAPAILLAGAAVIGVGTVLTLPRESPSSGEEPDIRRSSQISST